MPNTLHLTLFLLAAAACQLPPAYCLRYAPCALRGEAGNVFPGRSTIGEGGGLVVWIVRLFGQAELNRADRPC